MYTSTNTFTSHDIAHLIAGRIEAIEKERDRLLEAQKAVMGEITRAEPVHAPKPAVKRGRPKGMRKAEIPVPVVLPEIPLTRASDGVLHGELPTPKRRGRPKGSKNKPKASNGIVVTTELS